MNHPPLIAITLALAVATSSCTSAPEGQEWKPTLGANVAIFDDYTLTVSGFGVSASGDVDYSSFQLEGGATRRTPTEEGAIKHEFAGVRIGFGDITDELGTSVDLTEISGGGSFYGDMHGRVQPYFSIWSVISDLDGADRAQLGLRLGAGLDMAVSDSTGLIFEVDYLLPLISGQEVVLGEIIDVEGDGLAARIGLRFVP